MADSDITIEILKGIRSELRDFRQETSDFRQETNQRFGGVEDRLGEVEGRIAGVEGRRSTAALGGVAASSRGSGRTSRAHERTTDIGNQRLDVIESTLLTVARRQRAWPEPFARHGRAPRHIAVRVSASRDARRQARNAVTSSPRMPRPFAAPGTRTHFVGDRPARLQHVRLEWDLDLGAQTAVGYSDA